MEVQLPVTEYTATGVTLRARFESSTITLDDAISFLTLIKEVLEAVQDEMQAQTYESVQLLPVVHIRNGSIEVEVELRGVNWTAKLKTNLMSVLTAAILVLGPSEPVSQEEVRVAPVELSQECIERIEHVVDRHAEVWKFHGKGYEAKYTVTCPGLVVTSEIKVPPA